MVLCSFSAIRTFCLITSLPIAHHLSPIHTNYRAKVQRIFDMTKLFLIIEVFFAFLAQEFGYMQKKLYLCRLKLC